MKKAKLNIRFGKKKNGDKENVVSTPDSIPPKITLDILTLNSSLDILPDNLNSSISPSDTPDKTQEIKTSATPNQEKSMGLFDEILSELNTGKSSDFDVELSLNLELSKLLEATSEVKVQPISTSTLSNKSTNQSKKFESSSSSESEDGFIRVEQLAPNPNGMNGKKPINPIQRRKDIGQKPNHVENWVQDVNPKDGENNILDRMKDRHRAEAREPRDLRNPRSDTYSEDSRDMREDYRYGSRDRDDYRRDPRPRINDDRPIYDDRLRNNTRYPRERNNDYDKSISSNNDYLGYRQNNGNRIMRQSPSDSPDSSASSTTSDSSRHRNDPQNRSVIKVSKSRPFENEKIKEAHESEESSLSRQSSIASRKYTSPREFQQSSNRNLYDRVAHKGTHNNSKQSRTSTSSGGSSNHEERIVEESISRNGLGIPFDQTARDSILSVDSDIVPLGTNIKSISRNGLRIPFDQTARDSILSVDSDIVPLGTKYGITTMNAQDEELSRDSPDESSDDEPFDIKVPIITVKRTISKKKSMQASFKPSSSDLSSDEDDETYKGSDSDNEPPIPTRGKTYPPQQTHSLSSHIRKDRHQNVHSRSDSYDSNSALNGYRDREEFGYYPPQPPPHVLREKPANRYPVPPHQYRDEPPYSYREEVPYDGSRSRYANYPLPPEPLPLDHTPENSKKVPLIEMAGYRYDQNKRNQPIQPFIVGLDKRIRSPSPPNRYQNRGYPRERERYPQERGEYPPPPRQYNPPPPRGIKNGYDDRYDRYNDRYGNDRYNDRLDDRHYDRYDDRYNDRYDDRYNDRYNDRYDRYDD
ncbi:9014_t:CDS:2 [Funneliformis geosporum]|nr:9014_t:CDS:2 [Funneliformis geosporum]